MFHPRFVLVHNVVLLCQLFLCRRLHGLSTKISSANPLYTCKGFSLRPLNSFPVANAQGVNSTSFAKCCRDHFANPLLGTFSCSPSTQSVYGLPLRCVTTRGCAATDSKPPVRKHLRLRNTMYTSPPSSSLWGRDLDPPIRRDQAGLHGTNDMSLILAYSQLFK